MKTTELAKVLRKDLSNTDLFNYIQEQQRMITNEIRMNRSATKYLNYLKAALLALDMETV